MAGASAFMAMGFWLRSVHSRTSAFAALVAALAFGSALQLAQVQGAPRLFLSPRFLSSLFVVATVFGFAWAYWRFKDRCTTGEVSMAPAMWIASGFFLLTILSVDIHSTASRAIADAARARWTAHTAITVLWALGAGVFLAAGLRARSLASRTAGLVVLTIAGVMALRLFWFGGAPACMLFLSPRFLASLAVIAVAFAYAASFRCVGDVCAGDESHVGVALGCLVPFLLLGNMSVEIRSYVMRTLTDAAFARWVAHTALTMLWAMGSAALLGIGLSLRSLPQRVTGIVVLMVSGAMAMHLHGLSLPPECWLFLSPRFLGALAVVAVVFAHAAAPRRCHGICTDDERRFGVILAWAGLVLLWLNLSIEVYSHFREAIPDRERARWIAQMSLSITWALYSSALLSIGFWRRIRPLRFLALALFGLTAAKLVVVDMARVEMIFRILAFIGTGFLMIGASYLYHRLEQRITGENV